ncbi:hypothetical protein SRB17_32920 [Streptomyces sp. RB17]|uniref:integrin alpha n=1 Tax=Streptomyces sp. RB17 TaxID=2585197 RepID=UPI00130C60D8|nr:FG-GAP repeat protein [Streptomyces sp. RB17]MQY35319.1 hypothetical protein [Streptomyces sp. RB17]
MLGDVNGDGIDDVAIGAPGENRSEGVVDVLRGSRSGLTGSGNGYADLASSATGEDGGDGAVWVLRGRPAGLVTDAALVIGPRAVGAPYVKAGFGFELK